VGGGVAREIEEGGGQCCGCCVGACIINVAAIAGFWRCSTLTGHDQHARLGDHFPQFQALACLWISGIEKGLEGVLVIFAHGLQLDARDDDGHGRFFETLRRLKAVSKDAAELATGRRRGASWHQ